MKPIPIFPLLLGALLAFSSSILAQRPPLSLSLDIQVPVAPVPVMIGGRHHLVYELHVTNILADDAVLTGIDVLADACETALARYRGDALPALIGRPGIRGEAADKRMVGSGMRAVVYIWLPLEPGVALPRRLRHRIAFDRIGDTGRQPLVFEGVVLPVGPDSPVVLDPPLRGGPWAAVYDPDLERGHRRSIYTLGGTARIPARYAIDWIRVDDDGAKARHDAAIPGNWYGYGAEVLAVADAVVADARDDMEEPETVGASHGPMPLEQHSGNYVVLDLGEGRYAVYEHLKPGSLRVRPGDTVSRGQVIAALGMSGSSSAGPHLHFHIADANAILGAEGRPYVFRHFRVVGEYDSIWAFIRGDAWKRADATETREQELPTANSVVLFDHDSG